MKELSFNVGAVQQFIKESANSFDAKVGGGVVADNKKNNEKRKKSLFPFWTWLSPAWRSLREWKSHRKRKGH